MRSSQDIQSTSKRFFGSTHRITVAILLWTMRGSRLDLEELDGLTTVPKSSLHAELQALHAMGAVERHVVDRRVRYQAVANSAFWSWIESTGEVDLAEDARDSLRSGAS